MTISATWASNCYGGETIGHVIGACQIYEHSGNKTFLYGMRLL